MKYNNRRHVWMPPSLRAMVDGARRTSTAVDEHRVVCFGHCPVAGPSGDAVDGGGTTHEKRHRFLGNSIATAKYNIATFLPKFLMEQFRRYANIFFLAVGILQQIPGVSPTGKFTTLAPLLFILSISAVKELYEDFKRRRQDRRVNRKLTHVLRGGEWTPVRWMDVQVGDYCKVENGEGFPADLLLLSSSEPQGMAYIETSNLDGETNLKIRQGDKSTIGLVTSHQLEAFGGRVECDQPDRHLYEFNGVLSPNDVDSAVSLGAERLLLRGSALKNTRWIFGLVLYTGHETKLMMNSRKAPLKRSNVDVVTNYQILVLFGVLLFISLISAIFAQVWNGQYLDKAWYLGSEESDASSFGKNLLTFVILFNNLVPISLQVSLEVVRFMQAAFINADQDMYDEASDTPAAARTSNLNEELGQVKFLLTDKTGTLTQNVMVFKRASVAGKEYGDDDDVKFCDDSLVNTIAEGGERGEIVRQFLTAMAVCHTVVPEYKEGGAITYQASSPDENALVRGAKDCRYVFHSRTPDTVTIDADGHDEEFAVLHILEFTSERKRMGVVVRQPDGRIRLYVKGADNVIMERLSDGSQYKTITIKHLENFAQSGFRTLCFATTLVSDEFYERWRKQFHAASVALVDRETKMEAAAEMIETDLYLVGSTAIEDKLQDGVPETIDALLRADIRVWVLTGDKRETAINIGHSCNLIRPHMPVMVIAATEYDEVRALIRQYMDDLGEFQIGKDNDVALVVEGSALRKALQGENRADFMALSTSCRVVICCRSSPLQKAEIVEMVKHCANAITLAIGDGANDVAMIQAAHVGVGITGNEGLQAASAADYTIAQFRFLTKLLFVHGAWSFHRTIKLILYSFYKNICLYIIELWFALFSAWSGQPIFERWTIASYNVLFTAIPPLAMGLFDRTASAETMLRHPGLYKLSQDRAAFSVRVFWVWIIQSVFHSIVLFFMTMSMWHMDVGWESGRVGDWLVMGNSIYTYVVIAVNLKLGLEVDTWTWPIHLSIYGSIAVWFFFVGVYAHVWEFISLGPDFVNEDFLLFTSPVFWMGIPLVVLATLIVDVVYKVIRRTMFKTIADEVRELERSPDGINLNLPQLTKRRIVSFLRSLSNPSGVTNVSTLSSHQTTRHSDAEHQTTLHAEHQTTLHAEHRHRATSVDHLPSLPGQSNGVEQGQFSTLHSPPHTAPVIPTRVKVTFTLEGGAHPSTSIVSMDTPVSTPDSNGPSKNPLSETARLLRNVFKRAPGSQPLNTPSNAAVQQESTRRGFAFSQEERGVVNQTEIIRSYNTNSAKPSGD